MNIAYFCNPNAWQKNFIPESLENLGENVFRLTDLVPLDYLKENNIKIIISDRFPKKFPPNYLRNFKYTAINIHLSLLPRNRGSYPIFFSVINKEDIGWSIHHMSDKIDSGSVILQKKINFESEKNTFRSVWTCSQVSAMSTLVVRWNYIKDKLLTHSHDNETFSPKIRPSFHYKKEIDKFEKYLPEGWDTKIDVFMKEYEKMEHKGIK